MHNYRTHKCDELRSNNIGEQVRLSGWVHRIRDHGGLLFIDLRDHYGVTQCVVEPGTEAFSVAEKVRSEWVVCLTGTVKARMDETINVDKSISSLPTGDIELFINEIEILSKSEELPLPIFGEPDYPEDIRLKYRFLDLRRETIHNNIYNNQTGWGMPKAESCSCFVFDFPFFVLQNLLHNSAVVRGAIREKGCRPAAGAGAGG